MKRFVTLNGELKLSSMKSHDCHVMMQVFLPIAIRGILPKHVRHTITELCSFFHSICSKVLDPSTLDSLQTRVVETLCKFEINFVAEYFASVDPVGLPTSRHEGRLEGKGTIGSKLITPSVEKRKQAHLFVLHHVPDVHPYLSEHMEELRVSNPGKGVRALTQMHNKTFIDWFHKRVLNDLDESVPETVKWLAFGPREAVRSYEGYDINGYTFWTERQDLKSRSQQNSGVSLVASSTQYASSKDKSPVHAESNYYGRIQEIWELDYCTFNICLLCCTWVDNNRRCVRNDDPCGFTLVDLSRLRETEEPFVIASQVKQVFFVTDPADHKWSIVVPGKRSILGIGDVDNEEEYDAFEDLPPLPILKFVWKMM
ncbi:uncharacterized protein LOC130590939 isoform X2 [Beta vulgaris subsp. vulgaris]|uniref:uncharacterized protein LOC130590892 n=1 Tax=Beta vulgaris subsp. vulgaris TaxID=3555 RepID=UPI0025496CE3|nr:uncharacterized protein LOC130590892 [Beta vulgaris subsp. vulgaris]XP_057249717.1 uncharacterized protein LOC130590939 isoform X2 [Beta vulgaris subsp. vulgaris]